MRPRRPLTAADRAELREQIRQEIAELREQIRQEIEDIVGSLLKEMPGLRYARREVYKRKRRHLAGGNPEQN